MSATYQIQPFSQSVNFLPINVVSTLSATPTLIHTASSVNYDELWMSAYCYGGTDTLLNIAFGGTNAYQQMSLVIPSGRGLIPVINGLRFSGGVTVSAYASVTNSISILGSTNTIVFT